jgi:hypothetical protein
MPAKRYAHHAGCLHETLEAVALVPALGYAIAPAPGPVTDIAARTRTSHPL